MSGNSLNSDSPLDDLDHALDLALATYTPAEPRLGLEDRVRVRLAAASSSSHGRARLPLQWIWAGTGAFAVALLLLAMLWTHTRPTPPAPNNLAAIQGGASVPRHRAPARVPAAAPLQPSRKLAANSGARPRLTTAPIPRQPTQQQLIARLRANGPEAIASLAGPQSSSPSQSHSEDQPDKPLSIQLLPADPLVIEPIKIAPIDDDPAEPGGRP